MNASGGNLSLRFTELDQSKWQLKDKGDKYKIKGEITAGGKTYEVSVKINKSALQGGSAEETKQKIEKFFESFDKQHFAKLAGHTMTASSLNSKEFSVMKGQENLGIIGTEHDLYHAVKSAKGLFETLLPPNPKAPESPPPPVPPKPKVGLPKGSSQPLKESRSAKEPALPKTSPPSPPPLPKKPSKDSSDPALPELPGESSQEEQPNVELKILEKKDEPVGEKKSAQPAVSSNPPSRLSPPPSFQTPTLPPSPAPSHNAPLPSLGITKPPAQPAISNKPSPPDRSVPAPKGFDTESWKNDWQEEDSFSATQEQEEQPPAEEKSVPDTPPPSLETPNEFLSQLSQKSRDNQQNDSTNVGKKEQSKSALTPLRELRKNSKKKFGASLASNVLSSRDKVIEFFTAPKKMVPLPGDGFTPMNEESGPRYQFMSQAKELISSEKSFLEPLNTFLQKLKLQDAPKGKEKEFETLKQCLEEIVDNGKLLLTNLHNCIDIENNRFNLAKFKDFAYDKNTKNYFLALTKYSSHYEKFPDLFTETKKGEKKDGPTELAKKMGEDVENPIQAGDVIIKPIQRGPKYPLFLKEFVTLSSTKDNEGEIKKPEKHIQNPQIEEAMPELAKQIGSYVAMTNDIRAVLGLKFEEIPETPKRATKEELEQIIQQQQKVTLANEKKIDNALNQLQNMKKHEYPIGGLIQSLLKEKKFLDRTKVDSETLEKFQNVSGLSTFTTKIVLDYPKIFITDKFKGLKSKEKGTNITKKDALSALTELKEKGFEVDEQIKKLQKRMK